MPNGQFALGGVFFHKPLEVPVQGSLDTDRHSFCFHFLMNLAPEPPALGRGLAPDDMSARSNNGLTPPWPRSSLLRGVWRLADPKISLASMASIFLGACATASMGTVDAFWLVATILGVFLIEVGKNASGEVFDLIVDSAVRVEDRSPFSGGKRVLVDGLLTRSQTWAIAVGGFGGGVAIGLWIAAVREPRIFWIGLAGVACAYFYNGSPLKLAYRGLGELAVGLCYGPLIFAGTILVQGHAVTWELLALSLPLGLLITTFLWICQFPDYEADRAAGKRNLVVRLGRTRAAAVFVILLILAAAGSALLPFMGVPKGALLGLLFLAPGTLAAFILLKHPLETAKIIPAQALTLISFLTYSVGAGFGLCLFR